MFIADVMALPTTIFIYTTESKWLCYNSLMVFIWSIHHKH